MPTSRAHSNARSCSSNEPLTISPALPPVPKPTSEILTPVVPTSRYCMVTFLPGCPHPTLSHCDGRGRLLDRRHGASIGNVAVVEQDGVLGRRAFGEEIGRASC